MDIAAENYQNNKNRLRTIPELDAAQVRLLVELVAQSASAGEIARKLDLSEIDLDIILTRLGIESASDAKARLSEYVDDDAKAEEAAAALRERSRQATREAQDRLEEREALDAANNAEAAEAAREDARGRQDDIKDEDAARQRKFAENKPKRGDLMAQHKSPSKYYVGASVKTRRVADSKFPNGLETMQFREMLLQRGLAFIRDQYDVTDADIRSEMTVRNISLDFDLLPR